MFISKTACCLDITIYGVHTLGSHKHLWLQDYPSVYLFSLKKDKLPLICSNVNTITSDMLIASYDLENVHLQIYSAAVSLPSQIIFPGVLGKKEGDNNGAMFAYQR